MRKWQIRMKYGGVREFEAGIGTIKEEDGKISFIHEDKYQNEWWTSYWPNEIIGLAFKDPHHRKWNHLEPEDWNN